MFTLKCIHKTITEAINRINGTLLFDVQLFFVGSIAKTKQLTHFHFIDCSFIRLLFFGFGSVGNMQDTTLLLSQSNQLYLLSDNHLNSDIKMKKKKNPFLNSFFNYFNGFSFEINLSCSFWMHFSISTVFSCG